MIVAASGTPPFDRPRFDRPAFDRPAFGRHPAEVVELAAIPACEPLPDLSEPDEVAVEHPRDEQLIRLAHPGIRLLSNYFHAGWSRAIADTWVRAEVATRLAGVAERLPRGFGLAVFDAWRPLALQAELYEAAYGDPGLPPGYLAPPRNDPRLPPPHLTGGTVDLTLTFDGHPLALGTDFDDFTAAAAADSLEAVPGIERELRRLLYHAMRSGGFVVYSGEWWHFEIGTARWAAITGATPYYGPAAPPAGA